MLLDGLFFLHQLKKVKAIFLSLLPALA